MDFDQVLDQAIEMLQRRGRLSYRALKRQFDLDDDYLEDLKDAILYAHQQVVDDGRGLVWIGGVEAPPTPAPQPPVVALPPAPQELHAPPPALPPATPRVPDAERR